MATVVAGPYIAGLATPDHPLRASSNQSIEHLSIRYHPDDVVGPLPTSPTDLPKPTVGVRADGRDAQLTGFPAASDFGWLARAAANG